MTSLTTPTIPPEPEISNPRPGTGRAMQETAEPKRGPGAHAPTDPPTICDITVGEGRKSLTDALSRGRPLRSVEEVSKNH